MIIYAFINAHSNTYPALMAQPISNDIIFIRNNGREPYYTHDGELYTTSFPIEWARKHLPDTGPKECANCSAYGSWNGVFIGYCTNCAMYVYDCQRGRGFDDCGKENTRETALGYASVYETYLRYVDLEQVGDKDILDSAAMMAEEENEEDDFNEIEEIKDFKEYNSL